MDNSPAKSDINNIPEGDIFTANNMKGHAFEGDLTGIEIAYYALLVSTVLASFKGPFFN